MKWNKEIENIKTITKPKSQINLIWIIWRITIFSRERADREWAKEREREKIRT